MNYGYDFFLMKVIKQFIWTTFSYFTLMLILWGLFVVYKFLSGAARTLKSLGELCCFMHASVLYVYW